MPQERWMVIAMHLMQKEDPADRRRYVAEAYWALSNLYMTVATPTLTNAGKTHGQLSSCFIDTVDDSLQSIYDSNTDIAKLSKNGGGIGVYMGKVRGRGSSIKGFKDMSSGVVPWIKQLNNTAVSVDQLGTRKGAIAIYLDVWHTDIEAFLDLKLNNGDERLRAHDIFTGVCLPDYFMEQVE
ncbi:ribonucleotide reductase N-terminal alpha domain-containing protein, partial [Kitasatospora putterlickiae]|uniref:ribonucleotide reductase N-terminal alpha domain-containing protein n=1 Tax=Kitasatospora putterlickiae TaxID=221725 RepID=UPI0031D72245